jgi:ubiquinone/menaquinone biosynthesis C-methylase UbiE
MTPRFRGSLFLAAVLVLAGCTNLKRLAYEGFGRDDWQKPDQVVQSLNIRPGDRVADLGSGSGYFTFRLAQAVGPAGKVYAVDVDRGLSEDLAERAQKEGLRNIETVLARHDDPLLPGPGVDLIFTSNTYHHIEARVKYFADAGKYLRPDGRIAIVDFNGNYWFERLIGHYTATAAVKKEMEEAGYRLDRDFDFLERQSFLIFSKKRQ